MDVLDDVRAAVSELWWDRDVFEKVLYDVS